MPRSRVGLRRSADLSDRSTHLPAPSNRPLWPARKPASLRHATAFSSLDEDVGCPNAGVAQRRIVFFEVSTLCVAQGLGGVAASLAQPVTIEVLHKVSRLAVVERPHCDDHIAGAGGSEGPR